MKRKLPDVYRGTQSVCVHVCLCVCVPSERESKGEWGIKEERTRTEYIMGEGARHVEVEGGRERREPVRKRERERERERERGEECESTEKQRNDEANKRRRSTGTQGTQSDESLVRGRCGFGIQSLGHPNRDREPCPNRGSQPPGAMCT